MGILFLAYLKPDMYTYHLIPSKHPWALAAQAPKLGVGSYTEGVLEWFNYPRKGAHPGCELSCMGVPINLHRRFAHALSRPAQWWRNLPHRQPSEAFVACSNTNF